ncbi:MAG: NTP transferase domain-containing protein [Lutibacter sp.]|uniref:NTP transferase domain-containing protein n=1 Tax=Lutibacter sp. TaxID=1925666 RepID=UPI00299E3485|nr:NTP transferase domain-containing protein [Lutibacter sp.]MDX1829890.1 NTP transferase domain-containing protein [Lutibacter sp.]
MQPNTTFILLAGGKSERMGVDKGLLKYQHTFWILEQLHRISKTTVKNVYIGLGYNYKNYFKAIPWFENAAKNPFVFDGLTINILINKNPEFGTFSTLQTVLKSLKNKEDVLINHIDIPILNPNDFNKIIELKNTVVIPSFKNKKGHPVKLSYSFWKQLIKVDLQSEDARLDYQLKKLPEKSISYVLVNDSSITKNLNTKKDWISFLNTN